MRTLRRCALGGRVYFTSCAALLVIGGFWFHMHRPTAEMKPGPERYNLSFIPERVHWCEDIPLNVLPMSQTFNRMKEQFDQHVKNNSKGEGLEGFTAEAKGQYHIMHHLAGQKAVKTVCETGFNFGHSSFNYLTANDRAIVHSFDLGNHRYAHKMSKYLAEKFPYRFFIHFDDSTKTVPEFIRSNPGFQCDFIFVDGGHNYRVASADLRNFAKIANLEENLIMFDDHPTTWSKEFGVAWDEMIQEGVVSEITKCTFRDIAGTQRGFALGRVVSRPRDIATTRKP